MLDLAFKHGEEVRKKLFDTWYEDKYKYYNYQEYYDVFSLEEERGDWNSRKFVSINDAGEVIGLITYGVDRSTESANSFGAINFSDNKVTFGMDLAKVLEDIFCKFNMQKLEFTVIVGNPIEKTYDKMVKKYGGTIVGTYKKHCKLMDGKLYDKKMYELFREEYIARRGK